ncbi:MAG TPA: hypothetical protein VNF07_13110 [Acidimicrobiales bacterium]|nr:hypothetical protein [Acidimicrobiales bacterium]
MSWSSGKDSATALAALRAGGELDVTALLCTVNAEAARVAMHAVRRTLLEAQARAVGLPLVTVEIPSPCPNELYQARMAEAVSAAVADGVTHIAFGDLFLRDVRAYREAQLAGTGVQPVFPLWQRPTPALAREMLASGLRAVLTCVDTAQLDARFVGRAFDAALLDELPAAVDPCGERGEFHTFVWDGPGFSSPVAIGAGEQLEREGFASCDLLPGPEPCEAAEAR